MTGAIFISDDLVLCQIEVSTLTFGYCCVLYLIYVCLDPGLKLLNNLVHICPSDVVGKNLNKDKYMMCKSFTPKNEYRKPNVFWGKCSEIFTNSKA